VIVHCSTAEKFIEPFIDVINSAFDSNKHFFIVREYDKFPTKKRENVLVLDKNAGKLKKISVYLRYLNEADKIILHGIFDTSLVWLLFFQPWLLRKCYWVMWGGDLYCFQNKRAIFRAKLFEKVRAFVIKRMGHFVTYVRGDYELAQNWYGAKGQYHECIMYPSNLYKEYAVQPKEGGSVSILAGNSADPSNNHSEIFEKLAAYKDENIIIYCPLSYGPEQYVGQVVQKGKELFGEKFIPLLDFMPFDKYLEILGQIDIAVFAHRRQQAMGNAITLLGLGKKVSMRSDVTSWQLFKDIGVKVFDFESLEASLISDSIKIDNSYKIKEFFSEEKLKKQLRNIFDS